MKQPENSLANTRAKSGCTTQQKNQKKSKLNSATTPIHPLAPLRFTATVCDDTETMYRPAIYKISNYQPQDDQSELDLDKIPVQVVSNIGCYRNVARVGQQIKVAGTLEKVQSTQGQQRLLPSCCGNSHFGRRVHMATVKLRDRDAIQTAEGYNFPSLRLQPPQRRLHLRRRIRQLKHLPIKRPTCPENRQKRTLLQILQRRRHETCRQKISTIPYQPRNAWVKNCWCTHKI